MRFKMRFLGEEKEPFSILYAIWIIDVISRVGFEEKGHGGDDFLGGAKNHLTTTNPNCRERERAVATVTALCKSQS